MVSCSFFHHAILSLLVRITYQAVNLSSASEPFPFWIWAQCERPYFCCFSWCNPLGAPVWVEQEKNFLRIVREEKPTLTAKGREKVIDTKYCWSDNLFQKRSRCYSSRKCTDSRQMPVFTQKPSCTGSRGLHLKVYRSLPWPVDSLSAVSVTRGGWRSENIKWKSPDINNS